VRHAWTGLPVVLMLAACAAADPVSCGGCQGPHYSTTGFPVERRADSVTVCVAGFPCATTHHPHGFATSSQSLPALSVPAAQLDGRRISVVVRSGQGVWRGTSTLRDVPPSEGTCSCSGGLQGELTLARTR